MITAAKTAIIPFTFSFSSKIVNFFGSKTSETSSRLRMPDLKNLKPEVTRNQNNSFNITVNASKNDNAESISQKVVSKISDYSRTFLYDEAEVA